VAAAAVALFAVSSVAAGASTMRQGTTTALNKAVVCTAQQVLVTVKGKARCRSLSGSASGSDERLGFLREVIARDPVAVRTRSGKRVVSFWSAAGRRLAPVRTRLLRALPKVLAWVDAHRAHVREQVQGDKTSCALIKQAKVADQKGAFDGFSVIASATGEVQMDVSLKSGYAIEVRISGALQCSNLDLPACPTPAGELNGTDSHQSVISMKVTKDRQLVQSYATVARSKQTLKGKVADDAKLDTLDLQDLTNETQSFSIPGASLQLRLSVLRTAVIDMRTGQPQPGTAKVRVGYSFRGQGEDTARADADKATKAYEKTFPDLIGEERDNARRREQNWQTPGTCAKVTFDPASGTLHLQQNRSGTVIGEVDANAGGEAAGARWTITTKTNVLIISPPSQTGPRAPISYNVTQAGPGTTVVIGVGVTSTVGVAAGQWTQPTEITPAVLRLVGTFSGTMDVSGGCCGDGGYQHATWSGSAILGLRNNNFPGARGSFGLTSGTVTETVSGYDGDGTGCHYEGNGQVTLQTLPGGIAGGFIVTGSGVYSLAPYTYTATIPTPGIDVTTSSCNSPLDDGQVYPTGAGWAIRIGEQGHVFTSTDGLTYTGGDTIMSLFGGLPTTWTYQWDFHGETS
jgi:hypothetical protein